MDDAVIDGETIRHLREARGLTMVDLARAAGIDHAVVSRLERGLQRDLTVSALIGLARALGVAVDTLLAVSPEVRRGSGVLIGELGAAVAALEELTERQQRYAAALLRAYQAALHDDTMDRREDEARDA
jgi:transcriptional regulator with XRE-family HTH domain